MEGFMISERDNRNEKTGIVSSGDYEFFSECVVLSWEMDL